MRRADDGLWSRFAGGEKLRGRVIGISLGVG